MVYPVVKVTWHDAFTSGLHWGEAVEVEPATITSVGYWITDHPLADHLTLAQSIAADGQLGELLHVPEPMVRDTCLLHPHPPRRTPWRWFSG